MNASSAVLTGRATPMASTPAPMKRKIAAILAADVAGYSRLVAEDEERTLHDLAAAREVFDGLIAQAGGRIFNTAGDSVMCEFDSAVEAVRAAVDIQESMRSRNLAVPSTRRLEFRMGLTIGDVVERGGDLLGDGVNIAARLEGLAPPGGICVSRSVHEAVANKLSVVFRELGPRQVKNIPQPIHAYLVAPHAPQVATVEPLVARRASTPQRESSRDGSYRIPVRGIIITLAILAIVFVAVPGFKVLRATIESYGPAPSARSEGPSVPAAVSPPVNEAATVPQGQQAQPQAVPPKARPAERTASRPSGRDPGRTETPKAEAPKPDPAPADTPRSEAARNLPKDPAAAFAALARDGVLSDARTLPELYHNARALEAKGDRAGALAAYGAAAPLAGEAVDVHMRYASLLRAAKGTGGVRQTYGALLRTSPSTAAHLVMALSAEPEDRRARIEAFASANPTSPIAGYALAEALSDAREGGPTLTERRLAFDAADRFLEAAQDGELDGRFVDRTFLDGWIESSRRRRGEIESFFASAQVRPTASFARTASGWIATVSLPEAATAAGLRVGERGDVLPTTIFRAAPARSGRPATSSAEVELPSNTVRSTLYVTYRDRVGREAGPFPVPFDPSAATVEAGRATLERYPDSWVSFRTDIPDLLSFAGLVSNRCAISRATIGYGDAPPKETLPLPPCDATGPVSMPSGTALVRLPEGTDAVQVQLTYADGSESQVRTFRKP